MKKKDFLDRDFYIFAFECYMYVRFKQYKYEVYRNREKSTIIPNEFAPLVNGAFEMYSTGLYSIEFVRKTMKAKGLKIGKTEFNQLLRKSIYVGKIIVPELW